MTQTAGSIESTKPIRTFVKLGTCSETMFNVIDRAFEDPMQLEERASAPLAGGIVQRGHQCGMVWGASLAAGRQAFRRHGPGPKSEAEAIRAAQGIVGAMREHKGSEDCRDITGIDMRKPIEMFKYMITGKAVGCFLMAGSYAPLAYQAIDAAFEAEDGALPEPPLSCAAEVARRRGASEMHQTMAAGLAGGIGLCGGGCGALATAIWLEAMEDQEAVDDTGSFGERYKAINAKAETILERVLEHSGGALECEAIAGRRFESIAKHADFLHQGGCAEIIEACIEMKNE